MKTLMSVILIAIAFGSLPGCGGGSPAANTPTPPPAAAITGVVTPKSVSVVTAN
jgi:hypothetical protein